MKPDIKGSAEALKARGTDINALHHSPVAAIFGDADDATGGVRWIDLAAVFPLRPIRTEEQFAAASALMRSLLDIKRNEDEDDYLDVLSDLVGNWEDEHHAIPAATQADILRAFIEEKDVTQAEVAAATGIAETNLSAMLANKRGIGKATRAKLAAYFGVKPARFVVE